MITVFAAAPAALLLQSDGDVGLLRTIVSSLPADPASIVVLVLLVLAVGAVLWSGRRGTGRGDAGRRDTGSGASTD